MKSIQILIALISFSPIFLLKGKSLNKPEKVQIPDAKFEQKLVSLGLDNKVDGILRITTEIKGTKTLDLSSSEITDLQGIAAFSSLEVLIVVNNELGSLDLSGLPLLNRLSAAQNNIEFLNISDSKELTKLQLADNKLSSITLYENPKLQVLDLRSNEINGIDLSRNAFLSNLQLGNNQLTWIYLDKNLVIEKLYLDDNNLIELDISHLTQLTELSIQGNQLLGDLRVPQGVLSSFEGIPQFISSN